ncbi:MAG: relaxase/mobilization nuclease domain-containing protein [Eubacterium sp.]|nr:relaxase/mobilization nuclease domain-containing protein [Eubacterium sp.]
MAITKILHQKASPGRELGLHTKQLIAYIMNPDKTEQCILTGGINCLPDTAYAQMLETKKMFGKTGGRQSYHVIISLVPGEGTPEELYEMTEKFAAEFLRGEYEAVFAVHTDHEHLHSHLVFNSVNMVTGKKFQYKNGDWKYKMQPITNKLSEEYGLEIMPAEYSEDPKNMSRVQWENEKSISEYIETDAKYCFMRSGNRAHYIYLLKELGYEVKVGEHISVKAPGMKRFKRLGTISPELDYKEENGRIPAQGEKYNDNRIYKSIDPRPIRRAKLSPIQKKYYRRLYKMRVIEKRRFQFRSAQFYKDLKRFKELQEEYNFLVSEDIQSVEDLAKVRYEARSNYNLIDSVQKDLYRERAKIRRTQKQERSKGLEVTYFNEDEYRKKLSILKDMKRNEDKRFQIAGKILDECKYDTRLDELDAVSVSEEETELDYYDTEEMIPELPKPQEPQELKESSTLEESLEPAKIPEPMVVPEPVKLPESENNIEPEKIMEPVKTIELSKVEEVYDYGTVDQEEATVEEFDDITHNNGVEEPSKEIVQEEVDYDVELIIVQVIPKIQSYNITVNDFFLLSVEDKAAIWDVTEENLDNTFEAYRKLASFAGVNKSVADMHYDFMKVYKQCQEYKEEPWMKKYRQDRLNGKDPFNEDKKLVRTKVR